MYKRTRLIELFISPIILIIGINNDESQDSPFAMIDELRGHARASLIGLNPRLFLLSSGSSLS